MSEPPPSPYGYHGPPLRPIQSGSQFSDPSDPLISADYAGWRRRNIALLQTYWRPLVLLQVAGAVAALVFRIPAAIVEAIRNRGLDTARPVNGAAAREVLGRALPGLGIGLTGTILAGLVVALVSLAGMRLIVVAVTGGRPSVGDALRGVVGRLFPAVGWGLLAGLIVLAGLCACLLPGLYLLAVFLVLPAVVLFERGGAISRCFKLFHADIGASIARVATVYGIVIVFVLVSSTLSEIVTAAARAVSAGTGGLASGAVIATVFQVAVNAALGVPLMPLILTTYADERARREPLHSGILAHELATA